MDKDYHGIKKIWKPIDVFSHWIQTGLDLNTQQRIASLIIFISILLLGYGPFSGEPPFIYYMSAMAITLTGITWLTSLVAARKADSEDDES